MGFATRRQVGCTLCTNRFVVRWGPMIHPADRICDACITLLWELDREDPAKVEAHVRPLVAEGRISMPTTDLGTEIVDRITRLRDIVSTRTELETMLLARGKV